MSAHPRAWRRARGSPGTAWACRAADWCPARPSDRRTTWGRRWRPRCWGPPAAGGALVEAGAGGHLGEVAEVHQRGAPHRVRAARADPGHPQQHRPLQGGPRVPGTRGCCHDVALLNWISLYSNLKESRTSMAMDHVNLYQIYLWQWSRRLCVSCWVSSVTLNTDYSNSV